MGLTELGAGERWSERVVMAVARSPQDVSEHHSRLPEVSTATDRAHNVDGFRSMATLNNRWAVFAIQLIPEQRSHQGHAILAARRTSVLKGVLTSTPPCRF